MAFVHTSRYSLELAPPDVRAGVAAAPFGPPRRAYYDHLNTIKDDDPALTRYAATLAASGVALIPTLALSYLDLPGHRNPWDEPVARLLDPADIHLPADRTTGEPPRPANATSDGFPPGVNERLQAMEGVYCKAGARYLAGSGTDAFGTMPGISLHTELELLVTGLPDAATGTCGGNRQRRRGVRLEGRGSGSSREQRRHRRSRRESRGGCREPEENQSRDAGWRTHRPRCAAADPEIAGALLARLGRYERTWNPRARTA